MSRLHEQAERSAELAELLKAIAHPLRLRIIARLCEDEANVNALAEELGAKQATVSQQLRILRMSRLVHVARSNGMAFYSLAQPRLRELLACLDGCDSA